MSKALIDATKCNDITRFTNEINNMKLNQLMGCLSLLTPLMTNASIIKQSPIPFIEQMLLKGVTPDQLMYHIVLTNNFEHSIGSLFNQVIKYLVEQGANINMLIGNKTVLMRAVYNGKEHAVNSILAIKGVDVNATNDDGNGVLFFVQRCETCMTIIYALIQAGVNINTVNRNGQTAVEYHMCHTTSPRVIKQLICNNIPYTIDATTFTIDRFAVLYMLLDNGYISLQSNEITTIRSTINDSMRNLIETQCKIVNDLYETEQEASILENVRETGDKLLLCVSILELM